MPCVCVWVPSPCSGIRLGSLGSDGDCCESPSGGPSALEEVAKDATDRSSGIAESEDTCVFDVKLCRPPDGGSRVLDEGTIDSASGSPEAVENEGILELDDGRDGGSPSAFGEAAGLSGRRLASAEPSTGDCVAKSSPVSFVFAGGAIESAGRDAGFGAFREGVARSDSVVRPAGIGTGVGVGYTSEVDRSSAAGVNTIGGSKRAKVLNAN